MISIQRCSWVHNYKPQEMFRILSVNIWIKYHSFLVVTYWTNYVPSSQSPKIPNDAEFKVTDIMVFALSVNDIFQCSVETEIWRPNWPSHRTIISDPSATELLRRLIRFLTQFVRWSITLLKPATTIFNRWEMVQINLKS